MRRRRRAAATITGLSLGLVVLCGAPAATSDSAAQALQDLHSALDQDRFDSAAALYDAVYQRYPEAVSARLRARLLRHAEAALDAGDARRAGATGNAGTVTLRTAGGPISAPLVRLRRLTVGGRSLADMRVAALELPSAAGASGLLGMDFLQHFGFEIDPGRSVLLLTR